MHRTRTYTARRQVKTFLALTAVLLFGTEVPLYAQAAGGDIDNPDMEVRGFSVFGTNTTGAASVTSGWGNVYIQHSLEIGSNIYVHGEIDNESQSAGRFSMTPGVQSITAAGGIQPTGSYIRVTGQGSNIDITADPQIAAGMPGQQVVLQGTADDRRVKIDDGNGVQTALDLSFSLGRYDTMMLIFDETTTNWIEIYRSDN